MQTMSSNWRTLLKRAQAEPDALPDSSVPSSAAGLESLLHSYEQLYAEKERLRTECRQLRNAMNRGSKHAAFVPSDLVQADEVEAGELVNLLRSSIRGIQEGLEIVKAELTELQRTHDPSHTNVVDDTDPHRNTHADSKRASLKTNHASEGAADRWVLSYPTAEQLRLITSALNSHSVFDERV